MKSSSSVVLLRKEPARRDRHELAFLPAALEIVETPPSPIGRAIAIVIVLLFCAAISWASFSQIDIIATAPGKIVPSGRSKVIQPFETGVVRAIHVQDGQGVKAGDVLIELDPTMNAAEREHLRSDMIAAQLDAARLKAALSDEPGSQSQFQAPVGAPKALVEMQRQFLAKQVEEHKAKLAALDRQEAQKEAERDTIGAVIQKLNAIIPVIEDRLSVRKILYDKELGSKLAYLETLQQLVEQKQDLGVNKSKYHEAEAALAAIKETSRQTDAEYQRTLFGELAEAERKAAGLSEDLVKAEKRTKLQALTAPIDGFVQQLAVHTVGGVVTPAQPLLVIVPSDSHLEIEAMVSNRDVGFIKPGQTVAIKIETFNFTRYGLLHGQVLIISHDSIVRDKPQEKTGSSGSNESDPANNETRGQDLGYAARISLDRTDMKIDDNTVNLSAGMAVTAEIKTGSRTLMNYLISPLLRYGHDSMHER